MKPFRWLWVVPLAAGLLPLPVAADPLDPSAGDRSAASHSPLPTLPPAQQPERLRFSGYVQGRFEAFGNTSEADPPGPGGPVVDTFTMRRVRLVAAARPTEKIGARLQLDGAGGSVATRDAWLDYFFTGDPATGHTVTFGQMKVPFGFEVVQSSGAREAPERGRVVRFFFPGERDRGLKLASPTGQRFFYEVGVFNGIAPGRSGVNVGDNNNDKNVSGRVRANLAEGLTVGASFDFGRTLRTSMATGETPRPSGPASAANPYEDDKRVYGVDAQWRLGGSTELRGEYVTGKANGADASGYILQWIQGIGPRTQFVTKYDWFGLDGRAVAPVGAAGTPVGDSVSYEGTLSNLAFGVVHRLDSSTRVKLFYEIHGRGRERLPNVPGDAGIVPWLGNVLRFEAITVF